MGTVQWKQVLTMVDVVVLTVSSGTLCVALQDRPVDGDEPFPGLGCHVGGMIWADRDRSADETAQRNLRDKVGLESVFIEQLETFSGPDRDPRGWSVSIAYFALVREGVLAPAVTRGLLRVLPVEVALGESLAFDHGRILRSAVGRVRGKGAYSVLPARLLPEVFTLSQLEETYEAVTAQHLDTNNFRRKILALDILEETGETRNGADAKRPAKLFRLKQDVDVFDRRV